MNHPSTQLPEDTVRQLRKFSVLAESQGRLCEEQLHIIWQQHWFGIFVPSKYNGLNLSLPEAVRLEEGLAWVDGSLGWVVTLCAGAGLFVGYLEPGLAKEIFTGGHDCLAGSGQANGTAEISAEGYIVNGEWPYASGAAHATYFTANCVITENGVPVPGENGQLLIRSFIFKSHEVDTQANWKYLGLNATAGYSFSVKNVKIPANRAFIIHPNHAKLPEPVYRYPFMQLAETTIAANISGMCLYFLELAKEIINKRTNGRKLIEGSFNKINAIRKDFYEALDGSWHQHIKGRISNEILNKISVISRDLAQQSRNLVNEVYPYCGMEAARTGSLINMVWRNINTASQHSLLLTPGA